MSSNNNQDNRPDPDRLLRVIQGAELRASRARLKVFLGMAAGVGKTYAMLSQARELLAGGKDVVIGLAETHGRIETQALLEGFEIIPLSEVFYKDTTLLEFNLDAALLRKPAVLLIDELAHTNMPGSRHNRRYLDVLELLDAGIDVWTTLNVQHIESLASDVESITGIRVTETVPNTILDRADDIELIDLPPAALQKRLEEGKVYTPDRTHLARANFFRTGNLTALRELALRTTAERVDKQLRDYMSEQGIQGPWRTHERLLVAIGPSPSSEYLIRWTRRLSDSLEAPWFAVFVQGRKPLKPMDEIQVTRHLRLARELGAEVLTVNDHDIPTALLRVAHQENITRIIIGRPYRYNLIERLFRRDTIHRLIHNDNDIDITIVPAIEEEVKRRFEFRPASTIAEYLTSFISVACIGLLGYANLELLGYQVVGMLFLLMVAILPLFIGRGPVIVSALLSGAVWDWFFIPPQFTLAVGTLEDRLLLVLVIAIGLTSGLLAARVKERERQISRREERSVALYALSKRLAASTTVEMVIRNAIDVIERTFKATCNIVEVDENGRLVGGWPATDEKEYAVAQWVAEHKTVAGRHTDTLSSVSSTMYPLIVHDRCAGVISLKIENDKMLSAEQEGLLQTSLQLIASAIERERLRRSAERSRMMEESERLYSTLLNSISHELRTPIATIHDAATLLRDGENMDEPQVRKVLFDEIILSSKRLNRLVSNLLDMSRLEADSIKIHREQTEPGDILIAAIQDLGRELENRTISINIAENLPPINVDAILIEQCLVNLLNNALLYSEPSVPIDANCFRSNNNIVYEVRDYGTGIPLDAIDHVFEKFYRAPNTQTSGTGLGLSIAKGFVEAHGGNITVQNADGGGAQFMIVLPIVEPTTGIDS